MYIYIICLHIMGQSRHYKRRDESMMVGIRNNKPCAEMDGINFQRLPIWEVFYYIH